MTKNETFQLTILVAGRNEVASIDPNYVGFASENGNRSAPSSCPRSAKGGSSQLEQSHRPLVVLGQLPAQPLGGFWSFVPKSHLVGTSVPKEAI
jgi:hypothetical protein